MAKTVLQQFYEQSLGVQLALLLSISVAWPLVSVHLAPKSTPPSRPAAALGVLLAIAVTTGILVAAQELHHRSHADDAGVGIAFLGILIGLGILSGTELMIGTVALATVSVGAALLLVGFALAALVALFVGLRFLWDDLKRLADEVQ